MVERGIQFVTAQARALLDVSETSCHVWITRGHPVLCYRVEYRPRQNYYRQLQIDFGINFWVTVTVCMLDRINFGYSYRQPTFLAGQPAGLPAGWLAGRPAGWLAGQPAGQPAGQLAGWQSALQPLQLEIAPE